MWAVIIKCARNFPADRQFFYFVCLFSFILGLKIYFIRKKPWDISPACSISVCLTHTLFIRSASRYDIWVINWICFTSAIAARWSFSLHSSISSDNYVMSALHGLELLELFECLHCLWTKYTYKMRLCSFARFLCASFAEWERRTVTTLTTIYNIIIIYTLRLSR